MDRYVLAKLYDKQPVCKSDHYLVGLTTVFIASKYEDVKSISMQNLTLKIGHSKFTAEQIVQTEKSILLALEFKIRTTTLTDMVMIHFYKSVNKYLSENIEDNE